MIVKSKNHLSNLLWRGKSDRGASPSSVNLFWLWRPHREPYLCLSTVSFVEAPSQREVRRLRRSTVFEQRILLVSHRYGSLR